MTSYSPDIMNVREIIDAAFGDLDGNAVNFKLIQTVLFLIARQMRLLERRVEVKLDHLAVIPSGTTLSVTEIKIHAMQKKKKKTKEGTEKSERKKGGGGKSSGGSKSSSKGRKSMQSSSDKTSTDKSSSDKASTDKAYSDKTSTDKAFSDKASTYKSSSDKTSSGRTTTDKTSSDKTSSDKTSSDKISSDKTSSNKTSSGKTSSDKTSSDKTSSDKTSTDKTSFDKTSTERTSSSKTDRTSSSRTTSSQDKSTSKSSSGKSADRQTVSTLPTIADNRSENSSEPLEERTPSKSRSSEKISSRRTPIDTDDSTRRKPELYNDILEDMEVQKEKELRVIHQRADSFEETTKSPTPMASVGSMEMQFEKVLVVQRIPTSEARRSVESMQDQRRSPQVSVVTQDQFEYLVRIVRQLESRLMPVGTPGFPESAELMEELRRGASLTDAMAALQLSARLEATEKAIGKMAVMITDLAKQTPGIDFDFETPLFEAGVISGARGTDSGGGTGGAIGARGVRGAGGAGGSRGAGSSGGSRGAGGASGSRNAGGASGSRNAGGASGSRSDNATGIATITDDSTKSGPQGKRTHSAKGAKGGKDGTTQITAGSYEPMEPIPIPEIVETAVETTPVENEYVIKTDYITYQQLKNATKEVYDSLMNTISMVTSRTNANAEQAYKLSLKLDAKVETALAVGSRMNGLELLVTQYADQINALDTGLSSQMTNYQEQLTQMQHDLEIGLETMAEVMANTGGDTTALTDLNNRFISLQVDLDNMSYRQKDLKDAQDSISCDLEALWKEIEILRDTKSDREEVADALRDKAGIGQLNGLVLIQQFDAVRGDFEKRISDAYDKFDNQELVWQKIIDELTRTLDEKADLTQVESLRNEINKYLNIMKGRMQSLIDIVGEPKSAMLSKKLFRDTACLSCGSPAHMDLEKPVLVPTLPTLHTARQSGERAEAESKANGDGIHRTCYVDYPIPHPRDPRSHVCQRYCGGSHTTLNEGPSRVPPSIFIHQPLRNITTDLGTDGKMYLVDEKTEMKPCFPCNIPKSTPAQKAHTDTREVYKNSTNSKININDDSLFEEICVTPPAHQIPISE